MIAQYLQFNNKDFIIPPAAFRMLFSDIANAPVSPVDDVAAWNTFFDLPNLGGEFTSVIIDGNNVKLYGGSGIKIKPGLFYNDQTYSYPYLLTIDDQIGCITSVGGDAFSYCDQLTDVILPACTIVYGSDDSPFNDYGGFGECPMLVNINIPLLSVAGPYAFSITGITEANNFPNLVTIGNGCFSACQYLTTVDLPNLITAGEIVNSNFQGVFTGCPLLTTINLPIVETAGDNCFSETASLTSISLPMLKNAGYACFGSRFTTPVLTTVDLPLLETTGDYCFEYCTSLTSVYLPSCTNLGTTVGDDNVFFGITGQTITVIVPDALLTCNGGLPDGDLQYLIANNTVLFPLKLVGNDIISLPNYVSDWNTFFDLPSYGTPFTSVYYVGGSPSITYLFGGLGITLRAGLFNGSTIEQILDNQSNCIIAAGGKAFANSNLQTVDLPSVTTIGNQCFDSCYSLTYLSIPVCTAIGDDCSNNNVFLDITGQTISLIVSPYVMDCGGSHVPDGDITTLITNNTVSIPLVLKFNGSYPVVDPTDVVQWQTLFGFPTIGPAVPFTSVTVDGNNVYLYGGANILLNELAWKDNLVEIIDAAGCITALGGNCFKGCIITAAYLLGVTDASAGGAFYICESLVTAYLDKVTTIGGSGFLQCTSIETIYIPSCTNLGGSCGDNAVFTYITGATITLTVPNSIYTNCGGSGLPDADITYLQANNTVTVIGV